jgi:aryl-alcohol dehydrogenase-like predicted oxidoreductase
MPNAQDAPDRTSLDRGTDLLSILREATPVVAGTSKLTHSAIGALLGAFLDGGGVLLDTARTYADGESESVLGTWLRSGTHRERALVLTKGGHPAADWRPRLEPRAVLGDLEESLFRLNVGHVDVYLLHRDDPTIPVAELMGLLAEIRDSGKARWVGVSNWSPPRLREALADINPPEAVSNHFGLGVPAGPASLPGVVSAFDAGTNIALAQRRVPLIAWSSMSAGFFSMTTPTRGLAVACTHSALSLRRREAITQIAGRYTRSPEAVLARWLTTAASHLLPIFGTRQADRLRPLLAAAVDPGLDEPVAELVARLRTQVGGPAAERLLLPEQPPQW